MKEVKAKSYTLYGERGEWLGQIILTSDGLFASVTDYGNLSYTWRNYGDDFREFICELNVSYFSSKLYTGMAYIAYGKKIEKACDRFAEKILPPLQKLLREEIEKEKLLAELIETKNEIGTILSLEGLLKYEELIKQVCESHDVSRDEALSIVQEITNHQI